MIPDAYGRRRQRPWRSLAVLGMLLLGLVLGALLGRLLLPGGPPERPPAHAPVAGVPGVGPSRVVAGIPVGYAHSREGAAQAAGNYMAVLGGRLALDPPRLMAALDQVAEPSARRRLEQSTQSSLQVEESLWGMRSAAQEGRQVLLALTPIAYRVASYTPAEATVRVWLAVTVGVDGQQRLVTLFGNSAVTLTWLGGDWRLRAMDAGTASTDVIPANLQTPTPTSGIPEQLRGFVPYGG